MILITINALPHSQDVKIHKVLEVLCHEVANQIGKLPSDVKATFQLLAAGGYSDGGQSVTEQTDHSHPPIVTISAIEGLSDMEKENTMRTVAALLERGFGLGKGNVYINFNDLKTGSIYSNAVIHYHY